MNDWAYTFYPVSKKTWIDQVEKDLRGKSLNSLLGEWWSGETLQPLIHQEDAPKEIVRLPNELFTTPPRIVESIFVEGCSAKEINDQILKALAFGAETIILEANSLDNLPVDVWLKDVHPEMIKVQIQPSSLSSNLSASLLAFLKKGLEIRIARNDKTDDGLNKTLSDLTQAGIPLNALRFIYAFPSTGVWDDQATSKLTLFIDDLTQWKASGNEPQDFFERSLWKTESDPSYFKHIIQTRVLHLLWHNLMRVYNIESAAANNTYLECHIRETEKINPDKYLIRASMSALAASLTGTSSLCIHHLKGADIADFYKRTDRNIHHLLNMESNMYAGTDPLAGAYAIDLYTTEWTKKIWEGLSPEK